MHEFKYIEPTDTAQVIELLKEHGSSAAMMAGGTDLINHIRIGKRSPEVVLQLGKVRELIRSIEATDDGVFIGALATLTDVQTNELLMREFTALCEAAGRVGSKQIRNRATLVGNICNASPAADTVPPLLLFDASVHILGVDGERMVPIDAFITAPGRTVLDAGELVTGVFIPRPKNRFYSAYCKLSRRRGVDLSTVGAAAAVCEDGARIALGAVAAKAFRATAAEEILKLGIDTNIEAAIAAVCKQASPITDVRASADYRRAMAGAYAKKALINALSYKVEGEVD